MLHPFNNAYMIFWDILIEIECFGIIDVQKHFTTDSMTKEDLIALLVIGPEV
jgi:serine kinase of HPr protein (carbohydrate metabolism regulator)